MKPLTFSCTKVWIVISSIHASSCALRRQLAVDEQVGDLEVRRLLGELVDRVAAVLEDPLVAVEVRDRRAAGRGVHERRVVGHQPEVLFARLDLAQVDAADRPVGDRQLVALPGAVVGDAQRLGARRGYAVLLRAGLRAHLRSPRIGSRAPSYVGGASGRQGVAPSASSRRRPRGPCRPRPARRETAVIARPWRGGRREGLRAKAVDADEDRPGGEHDARDVEGRLAALGLFGGEYEQGLDHGRDPTRRRPWQAARSRRDRLRSGSPSPRPGRGSGCRGRGGRRGAARRCRAS